jgi:hypothetical protein
MIDLGIEICQFRGTQVETAEGPLANEVGDHRERRVARIFVDPVA